MSYSEQCRLLHGLQWPRINSFETAVQPRLSERRINVLKLVAEHPRLSLYSINAPLPWAGGVTLLGLMSWLNMPSEIICLLDITGGLLEVDAMDEHGATPLMCMFNLLDSIYPGIDPALDRRCARWQYSGRQTFGMFHRNYNSVSPAY